ncbi:hypothetical protein J7E90_20275 [Streptomyces sp. ISL-111]|uniref:hypothetical protein n=1 Tax=Streptomyces sp. ISL-111 TaxID=2819175 RepID=UPI001BEC5A2C|nr:hypothetical protein [Streptomyces sp. ISL-111]MBT2379610.1 hypothetical protein [Streptomyces sp. ISL-111]
MERSWSRPWSGRADPTNRFGCDREWTDPPGKDTLPAVCGASSISVSVDAAGDLRIAGFRQDSHYLRSAWDRIYKPIRSHNEGLNGRCKGAYMDIGNLMHRRAPGQVAQKSSSRSW